MTGDLNFMYHSAQQEQYNGFSMDFLIVTEPDDAHSVAVQLALECMGHSVKLLFTADQPTKQKNSVFISNQGFSIKQ